MGGNGRPQTKKTEGSKAEGFRLIQDKSLSQRRKRHLADSDRTRGSGEVPTKQS